ncbi:MAG: diguanylate cyclase [Candidatus Aminicenantes bacterium]|nr:diguanylate cyclase [Candidatus Aminicenantes bacterium]
MTSHAWVDEFPAAITVSDDKGTIIEMNAGSVKTFEKDGGEKLVGTNVLDCHAEPARTKLRDIMDNRKTNVYTIEKAGVKKLIYQAPWYRDGQYSGMIEISFEVPFDLPHFIRD